MVTLWRLAVLFLLFLIFDELRALRKTMGRQ